jgi:hypothetical protein
MQADPAVIWQGGDVVQFAAGPDFNYAGVFDSRGIFNPVDLTTPLGLA